MSNDDLMILNGLDQSLPVDNEWALGQIELSIQKSIDQKNAFIALNVCRQLIEIAQVAGLALAKAFYLIEKNWDKFEADGDFDEVAYEYLGRHPHTIERYVKVWSMFEENIAPKELQQRNIKDLIPIANAVAQGYEIEKDTWDKISEAPDYSSVSKIIREDVKGKEPRKSALLIFIDNEGTLTVQQAGDKEYVGYLNVDSMNDMVDKAIERITKDSGILRS